MIVEKEQEKPDNSKFVWAIRRLAAIQGRSIDPLLIEESAKRMSKAPKPLRQLKAVCKTLGWTAPVFPKRIDQTHLPLLCYTQEHGWAVVIDRNAQGQWVLSKEEGLLPVSNEQIKGCVASLKVSTALGWRLFDGQSKSPKFFDHIRVALLFYTRQLTEACIASAFIGFLALATSLYSMQVYDRVIPTRSEDTLIILSSGVLLTILIELLLKFTRSRIMDQVTVGMDSVLSREVFQRLLHLRVDQMPATVGSLAGQLRGYEQLRNFYTASTLFALIDLPLAILFLLAIVWIATPWVALVPAIATLVVMFFGLTMRNKSQAYARQGASLSNMKTGLLVEAVEGIETIKSGSGGWKFLSRWIDVNATTIKNDLKIRHSTENANYWIAAVQQISYASQVALGALVVMHGDMTMGSLIACSILGGRILAPVMALPNLMVQHAHAQAALEGIERLYALKVDLDDVEHPLAPEFIKGHYILQDVKFAYGDNPASLVIPKLEIQPGERIAVLGPIGAGKSTLLRLLSGLYHTQSGRVLIDNLDITHIQRQVINQEIGYLQQDHRLFQGTLRENLLIGLPDPGDELLLQAMRRTGMDQFVAAHPQGLGRRIAEGGKGLSGGQKQLLAFTRLLLCQPKILLLDEPTATMDEEQERRCLSVLAQELQTSSRTLLVVTHKIGLLGLVNRIIVVAGNQIVLDGPRDRVLLQLQEQAKANATPQNSKQAPTLATRVA